MNSALPRINYFVPPDRMDEANQIAIQLGYGPDMFAMPAWPSTNGGPEYCVASSPTADAVLKVLAELVAQIPGAWVLPGDFDVAAKILHIRRPDWSDPDDAE